MWICYKFLKSLTPTPLLFQHATAPKTVPAVVWNCFNYHPNPTPLSPKTAQHCAHTTPTLKPTLHPIKTLGSYNFCICKSWILHPLPSVKTNSLSCYQIVMLICKYQIYMLRNKHLHEYMSVASRNYWIFILIPKMLNSTLIFLIWLCPPSTINIGGSKQTSFNVHPSVPTWDRSIFKPFLPNCYHINITKLGNNQINQHTTMSIDQTKPNLEVERTSCSRSYWQNIN